MHTRGRRFRTFLREVNCSGLKEGYMSSPDQGFHPIPEKSWQTWSMDLHTYLLSMLLPTIAWSPNVWKEVTSVTTGKSKQFNTPGGRFHIGIFLVPIIALVLVERNSVMSGPFLSPSRKKAVADRVLREKGRFSVSSMRQFLFENLRMDSTEFRKLNIDIFDKASKLTGRQSLEMLRKVKEDLSWNLLWTIFLPVTDWIRLTQFYRRSAKSFSKLRS